MENLTWVKFSLDAGSANVYSQIHNVNNEQFNKVISNIKNCVKLREIYNFNVTIGVQFLLISENITDLENLFEIFKSEKLDYIVIKPYSKHPKMIKQKSEDYSREIIQTVGELVEKYQKMIRPKIIFRSDATDKYAEGKFVYSHCFSLPFWGYINSLGDFYTCSVHLGDDRFKVGNIYNDTFKEIVYGGSRRKSIKFAENELNIADCRINCRMARINEFLEKLNNKPNHINFI